MSSQVVPTSILSRIRSGPIYNQCQSPLFSNFPGEIRDNIFYHVFADTMCDIPYGEKHYLRPSFGLPERDMPIEHRKCFAALLRSCKRVYLEAWSLPFTATEHTLYMDHTNYATYKLEKLQAIVDQFHRYQVELDGHVVSDEGKERNIEIDHVRIFPALFFLRLHDLNKIFKTVPYFSPRCVTFTFPHSNWVDHFNPNDVAASIKECVFPASTRMIRWEMETLETKKDQLEMITNEMREKWKFKREDHTIMDAKEVDVKTMKWSEEPLWFNVLFFGHKNKVDYINQTVTWTGPVNQLVDFPVQSPLHSRIPSTDHGGGPASQNEISFVLVTR